MERLDPASFRGYSVQFEMKQIFSAVLVYCNKMSTIASLGAKEEIKDMLHSLVGSLKMFSNIYKGNFCTKASEFQREGFVDVAKPTTFNVIHKRS